MLSLWMVRASHAKQTECTHFYALDESQARQQARAWLEARPHLPEQEFRHCPQGYMAGGCTWLPGTSEETLD